MMVFGNVKLQILEAMRTDLKKVSLGLLSKSCVYVHIYTHVHKNLIFLIYSLFYLRLLDGSKHPSIHRHKKICKYFLLNKLQ